MLNFGVPKWYWASIVGAKIVKLDVLFTDFIEIFQIFFSRFRFNNVIPGFVGGVELILGANVIKLGALCLCV